MHKDNYLSYERQSKTKMNKMLTGGGNPTLVATETATDFNFWFLKTVPVLLTELAETTVVSPEKLALEDWKQKLLEIAGLLQEADTDTCKKYAEELKEPEETLTEELQKEIEEYQDFCKTKALVELNHYFWYLNN